MYMQGLYLDIPYDNRRVANPPLFWNYCAVVMCVVCMQNGETFKLVSQSKPQFKDFIYAFHKSHIWYIRLVCPVTC